MEEGGGPDVFNLNAGVITGMNNAIFVGSTIKTLNKVYDKSLGFLATYPTSNLIQNFGY